MRAIVSADSTAELSAVAAPQYTALNASKEPNPIMRNAAVSAVSAY